MSVKLLTEHHLKFLSFKRGCTGLSESTLVKNVTLFEISCCDSITHLLLYFVCRNPEINFEAGYQCQSVMT